MIYLRFLVSLTILLSCSLTYASTADFPGRQQFPEVKIYSMERLYKHFNSVIIVDARSNYEFDTIHINNAINIPVSSRDFSRKIKQLRNRSSKAIVFYCNGRSCYKSYQASKAAMDIGITNVYAYDAGMFEWAKTYPQNTSLLGHSPISPASLISKEQFRSHTLSPKDFSTMVYQLGEKARVVDVRDLTQRSNGIGYFVGMETWISLNNMDKVISYLRQAAKDNKTLLIYDGVGKQVRWLQYTLEKEKIKHYFFMDKGANGFYDQIINLKK